METTILKNARIFTSSQGCEELHRGYILMSQGVIQKIGSGEDDALTQARAQGASEIDLNDKIITPGFIDSHVHFLAFGLGLGKLNIVTCKSFADVRSKIAEYAQSNPSASRISVKGWIQGTTDGKALASMLDDIDPRPIYIEAMDQHSVWCNTAALLELNVASMENPPGGTICRDEKGAASGLLMESAYHGIVIPFLVQNLNEDDKRVALQRAVETYSEAGCTGVVDMAMDKAQWEGLRKYREHNEMPLHIAAHWMISYSDNDEDIQRRLDEAIAMHKQYHPSTSPRFCINGIKIMVDGTVDGCTAALSQPYGGQSDPTEPIWSAEKLKKVVQLADAAGLQCAVHAIGDKAISQIIDAYASLGNPTRRHRIEHLELASEESAKRLGQLGIIASVQPVHSDPVLMAAWPDMIGEHRCKRAFAYREFHESGARLAFGTDVPTAAHPPLPNLYHATTRRSTINPSLPDRTNPEFAVPMAAAVKAATINAAFSRFAETWTGSLAEGMSADLVVLDGDWEPENLLNAKVQQTWYRGQKVFDAHP
ncbi:hypothetical protein LTS17_009777 [Exophiala oligosperma]